MSRFQPQVLPQNAPVPQPNPLGVFPPVPPVLKPKTYSSTPLDAGMPTIAALQQRQEELTAPKMPAIQDPLQGAAYLTDILSTNLQENAALNMEGQQRQKLAEIAGGALGGGGVTPELVEQAMAIDPEGMGAFLYKQALDARNAEKWEPVPGHPEVQRNTVTGELKESHMGGPGGNWKASDISALRQDVLSDPAYKNIASAAPIYRSLVDTSGRDTGASDLNFVYGIAKIFDPTSVVREGEIQMANSTADVVSMIQGLWSKAKDGTSSMTPEIRANLLAEARSRMEGYQAEYNNTAEFYRKIAQRNGLNIEDIVPSFNVLGTPEETPTPDTPTTEEPPLLDPASEDGERAWDQLPDGQEYTVPDGRRYKRNRKTGDVLLNAAPAPVGGQ
jgi:hypothetical protein